MSILTILPALARRAALWLALPLMLMLMPQLAGCAAPQAQALSVAPLLDDALFNHPPRPAEADAAMALDAPMRAYLADQLAQGVLRKGRAQALSDALYQGPGGLKLDYDAAITRTAAQAFAARSGNCLSLVLMTAAFARELGLEVTFQRARLDEAYSRLGDLTLRSDHVNLVLAPRSASTAWRVTAVGPDPNRLQIDFLPSADLQGLRSVPIDEATVQAMFMNNRAAEALGRGDGAQAYAWAREALRRDASFRPALNTLGVVYQRASHLGAAAQAYEALLAQDPQQVATMWNLAQVRQAQGRNDEARLWTERRLAIEPAAPFQSLQAAEAAIARGDWAAAQALLQRERRVTGDTHELHFALALLGHRQGQAGLAQREMQRAMDASPSASLHARYAGKLAWLKAQGAL